MVYYWIYHITPNNYIVRSSWCWRIKLPSEGLKESTYFIQMDYGWDRSNNHPKLQWGCSFGKELVPRNAFGNTSNDYPFQDWFFPISSILSEALGTSWLHRPFFKAPKCGTGVCRPCCCWLPTFLGASPPSENTTHRRRSRVRRRGGRRHGGRRAMTTHPSPGP